MIRAVLAVLLATALLGAALPVAERAERDRNAALATGELQRLADRAGQLAVDNDPVSPSAAPAATTVAVRPPDPQFTDGGRVVVADDRLLWEPRRGENETVESPVPIRVASPIRIVDETDLRLSFVRVEDAPDGEPGAVVRVEHCCRATRSTEG